MDAPGAYCGRCGLSIGPGAATERGCSACLERRPAWDRLVRLAPYAPPVDRWIRAMKFERDWSWATWFGARLGARMATLTPSGPVAVCPVPMHWMRRGRRGYNQADLIAASTARRTGWPLVRLLRRRALSRPQSRLGASGRAHNVQHHYVTRRIDMRGWTIWLVDDVKTTGATLGACARAIRRGGAGHVHVAVVAAADPPGAGRPPAPTWIEHD